MIAKIRSLPITTQLTIGLILVAELSLLLTGGALTYISFQSQLDQLRLTQSAQAEVISRKIDAYVDDLQRGLTYLARVRGLTTFDTLVQHQLLDGLTHHDRAYEIVGLTDRQGHLQQGLSPIGEPIPQEWAGTAAYRRAFQAGEDFIGPVEMDATHPWSMLILAVPVRDADNTVDGMLFAQVDLKYLWAVLDEAILGKSSYVYILDQRRFVIAQSGGLTSRQTFEDLSQASLGELFTAGAGSLPPTYSGLHHVEVLGSAANLTVTNWRVVVELPVASAYQPLVTLLGTMGIGLLVAAVAAALGGFVASRQIVEPLGRLTEAATEIQGGNLDVTVRVEGDNELGLLARAFNKMSAQLREVIHRLQEDIGERIRAEEALEAKNKELENYLYVTSHDLRSPMVNIQGFSQRLQRQVGGLKNALSVNPVDEKEIGKITDEDLPRTLEFISANVSKMDNLISGLLQLSRTGRVKLAVQKIDMNRLMDKVVGAFSYQFEALDAKVEVADLPACYGDEYLLNQLFSNLLSNALKYRDKNRRLFIMISARRDNNKIMYSVKDNGIGIAAKYREKIWDVFYRVDPRSAEAGDGLGLSIVKTIADKHRGTVSVESQEGEGSTFSVELPENNFKDQTGEANDEAAP